MISIRVSFSASLLAADDDEYCPLDLMRRRSPTNNALLNSISNLRLIVAFGVFCDLYEARDKIDSLPLGILRRSKLRKKMSE